MSINKRNLLEPITHEELRNQVEFISASIQDFLQSTEPIGQSALDFNAQKNININKEYNKCLVDKLPTQLINKMNSIQESLRYSKEKSGDVDKLKCDMMHRVVGVDTTYITSETGEEYGLCYAVMADKSNNIIEEQMTIDKIKIPYLPGYFAFRELPLIVDTLNKFMKKPTLIFVDGNGILHQRRAGIATHLGNIEGYNNIPIVGISKSMCTLIGNGRKISKDTINKSHIFYPIVIDGEIIGTSYRPDKNKNQIFISVGNGIDDAKALEVTIEMTKKGYKLPYPLQMANDKGKELKHLKIKELI